MRSLVCRALLWALRHVKVPVLLDVKVTVRRQIADGGKIYWNGDRLSVIGPAVVRQPDEGGAWRGGLPRNRSPGLTGRAPHLREVSRPR